MSEIRPCRPASSSDAFQSRRRSRLPAERGRRPNGGRAAAASVKGSSDRVTIPIPALGHRGGPPRAPTARSSFGTWERASASLGVGRPLWDDLHEPQWERATRLLCQALASVSADQIDAPEPRPRQSPPPVDGSVIALLRERSHAVSPCHGHSYGGAVISVAGTRSTGPIVCPSLGAGWSRLRLGRRAARGAAASARLLDSSRRRWVRPPG
jgi:hypothetical protein